MRAKVTIADQAAKKKVIDVKEGDRTIKVGIIDLIATVYNALSYAFLAIYVLPLITVGVYKIFKLRKAEKEEQKKHAVSATQKHAV